MRFTLIARFLNSDELLSFLMSKEYTTCILYRIDQKLTKAVESLVSWSANGRKLIFSLSSFYSVFTETGATQTMTTS